MKVTDLRGCPIISIERRDVYIVRSEKGGNIHKVFGVETQAEKYLESIGGPNVIDVWQIEFKVEVKV